MTSIDKPATPPRALSRRTALQIGCAVVAAGAGAVLYSSYAGQTSSEAAAAALRKTIEADGGFRVVTDGLQKAIGPSVVMPDRPVALTDLGRNRLGPFTAVENALSLYPPGFVARFVGTLALAGNVVFWTDTAVGGFFFTRGICLNAGNPADAGDVTTRLFHHELSSLVRLGAAFDDARWAGFNPPGFHYLDDAAYRALLKTHPHEDGDDALRADGFVRPYGESDLDNDWNTYAEEAFGNGTAFAHLIRPYPRMRQKTAMLIEIYRGLDARFADYFEKTGLSAAVTG